MESGIRESFRVYLGLGRSSSSLTPDHVLSSHIIYSYRTSASASRHEHRHGQELHHGITIVRLGSVRVVVVYDTTSAFQSFR